MKREQAPDVILDPPKGVRSLELRSVRGRRESYCSCCRGACDERTVQISEEGSIRFHLFCDVCVEAMAECLKKPRRSAARKNEPMFP